MNRFESVTQTMTGFNRMMDFRLVGWEPDLSKTFTAITPDMLNSQGIVHGGVYCAFLDFTCGMAGVYHAEGEEPRTCMTLSLTTNFVASTGTGALHGTGRRIGGGRSIFYVESEIRDDDNRLLATSLGTFKYTRTKDKT